MRTLVVIPCRNEESAIVPLLDAIDGQDIQPQGIVVVDDASSDRTRDVVEQWAAAHALPVTIVPASGRGAGAAMNTGIARADADIIIRLDGHCRPASDYIAKCIETLDVPQVGVAGGVWQIEPAADTLMARGIASVLSHPLGSGGAEYRRPPESHDGAGPRAVDTVPFGAFRKSVWAEVGGFDEGLVRNQDYDFNYRVRLTGRNVLLNPAIVSVYRARPTLRGLARQYFDYGFWKVVMLRKFPASIRLRQLVPLMLAPVLLAVLVWAAVAQSAAPLWFVAAYAALDLGAAIHATMRARVPRAAPYGALALLVLQNAWSAGAWAAMLKGRPSSPPQSS